MNQNSLTLDVLKETNTLVFDPFRGCRNVRLLSGANVALCSFRLSLDKVPASTSTSSALRLPFVRDMDGLSAGGVAEFEPDKGSCASGCTGRNDATGVVSGVGEVREREGGISNAAEADWEIRSCLSEAALWSRLGDFVGSRFRLVSREAVSFSFP